MGKGYVRAAAKRAANLIMRGEGRRVVVDTVYTVRRHLRAIRRTAGLRSRLRMAGLVSAAMVGREEHRPPATSAVAMHAPELGPQPMWLRPRSRDHAAFEFLEEGHHLPPDGLSGPIERIAVFGANIGLLLADLAVRHPTARLLGVEPDLDNAAVARRNLAHLGDRCTLVEAAVWHRNDQLAMSWGRDAWGLNLTGASPDQLLGDSATVVAVDAAQLLAGWAGDHPIDHLLINIESGWYELLAHGDWMRPVRAVTIEIQDHYDEAVGLVEAQGYRAWMQRLPWGAFVRGVR